MFIYRLYHSPVLSKNDSNSGVDNVFAHTTQTNKIIDTLPGVTALVQM